MYIFDDTDDAFPVSFFPSTRAPITPSTWAGLSDKLMAPITRALERTKADSAPADGDEAVAREGGGGVRTLFTFCGAVVDIGAPLKALAKSTFERVAAAKDALQPKIVVSEAESSESE